MRVSCDVLIVWIAVLPVDVTMARNIPYSLVLNGNVSLLIGSVNITEYASRRILFKVGSFCGGSSTGPLDRGRYELLMRLI